MGRERKKEIYDEKRSKKNKKEEDHVGRQGGTANPNPRGGRKIGPKCLGACRSRECPNIDLVPSFPGKVRERNPRGYIFPTPDREIDWAKRRVPRKMRHRG
ncbi:hypothetical protein NPIL_12071 [Nephila pilipes]|uniref:Uncharacterized protein n=1 Tax=Nephila pilipes TaxID=299642 RepID=A0A8X6UK97_NEPPI|nr:hypothetical protein NPIL_12071 [Nephila pilipes]